MNNNIPLEGNALIVIIFTMIERLRTSSKYSTVIGIEWLLVNVISLLGKKDLGG